MEKNGEICQVSPLPYDSVILYIPALHIWCISVLPSYLKVSVLCMLLFVVFFLTLKLFQLSFLFIYFLLRSKGDKFVLSVLFLGSRCKYYIQREIHGLLVPQPVSLVELLSTVRWVKSCKLKSSFST